MRTEEEEEEDSYVSLTGHTLKGPPRNGQHVWVTEKQRNLIQCFDMVHIHTNLYLVSSLNVNSPSVSFTG